MLRLSVNFGHPEVIWLLNLTIFLHLSWWEVLLLYASFLLLGSSCYCNPHIPSQQGDITKYLLSRNWSTSLIVTGILGFCNAVSNSLQVKTSIFHVKIKEINGTPSAAIYPALRRFGITDRIVSRTVCNDLGPFCEIWGRSTSAWISFYIGAHRLLYRRSNRSHAWA